MALILDSGVVIALLSRRDPSHAACRELVERTPEQLVLPAPTLPEIDYLIRQRSGPGPMVSLVLDIVAGAFVVEEVAEDDWDRVANIMDRYEQVGFVDAAVLAIVERFDEPKLATLDRRHFSMVRPRHVDALELLPA